VADLGRCCPCDRCGRSGWAGREWVKASSQLFGRGVRALPWRADQGAAEENERQEVRTQSAQ
jgi:hypothetical protein